MPREIVTKTMAYTYAELKASRNARAVEKARQLLFDWSVTDDWYDDRISDWTACLETIGFPNAQIQFSGFASQGDGASFTADLDLAELITWLSDPIAACERHAANHSVWWSHVLRDTSPPAVSQCAKLIKLVASGHIDGGKIVRTDRGYCHEYTCGLDVADLNDPGEYVSSDRESRWVSRRPRVRALYERFLGALDDWRICLCRRIYRDLADTYDSLTSDAALEALAADQGYLFTKSGDFAGVDSQPETPPTKSRPGKYRRLDLSP